MEGFERREGRKEGELEGGREGWKRESWKEGGRVGRREGGRERGLEEGEEGRVIMRVFTFPFSLILFSPGFKLTFIAVKVKCLPLTPSSPPRPNASISAITA